MTTMTRTSPTTASAAAAAPSLPPFTPDRPAAEVDTALRQALAACDRARECAVLWIAEVQRRALYRQFGHASLELYAVHELGFSRNRYWQFKRLADDLDRLPILQEAVARGDLGWTKAQQVARVAGTATQAAWVEKAKATGRRELEREVMAAQAKPRGRGASGAVAPAQLALGAPGLAPAQIEAASPPRPLEADPPTSITLRADSLQLARYEALVERVRKLGAVPRGADRMELVLAALAALVEDAEARRQAKTMTRAGAAGPADPAPRRARPAAPAARIVIQQCPECGHAAAATARGERALAPAQLAAARCDAIVHKGGKRNRATIAPATRAAVLARDRHRCAAPGCGSARFLEVHHVVPREAGGSNRAENLVTLCGRCHRFAHEQARREASGVGDGA
ncbi:MAG: HNH endonuclease [bacterium]|nr:HNH endonuclease [bacterium]